MGRIPTKYETEIDPGSRGPALARLAARQHGVVSLAQLRGLGLSESAVRSRVQRGRLHRLHSGVYAVGHRVLPVEGRWMASVLACGLGAVLSHRSAAELWGLSSSARAAIDVTVPCRSGRSRAGIDFLWRSQGLAVETDGHATHGTRRAFEQDRRRDRMLMLAGWRVARCTWRDVTREPDELMRTILALLGRSSTVGRLPGSGAPHEA